MRLLSLLVLFVSLSAIAQSGSQPKHLVGISTDGLGWSGLATVFEWDDKKSGQIKDQERGLGRLSANYHYIFDNRVMVGGEILYVNSTSETKDILGIKDETEFTQTRLGISVGYNFNEDLLNSWWIKGMLFSGKETFEFKTTGQPTQKDKDRSSGLTISGGKRWSLSGWGLGNVTYSPSIAFESASYKGDEHKTGKDSSAAFRIDLIRLDVLF